MDELVVKARQKQPGLIVVDRAVHGKNQNYLTPENRVPVTALPHPWETCMVSAESWSYKPGERYMSGRDVVHLLVDVVAIEVAAENGDIRLEASISEVEGGRIFVPRKPSVRGHSVLELERSRAAHGVRAGGDPLGREPDDQRHAGEDFPGRKGHDERVEPEARDEGSVVEGHQLGEDEEIIASRRPVEPLDSKDVPARREDPPHDFFHLLNFFTRFHVVVFKVDEKDVVLGIVGETVLQGDIEEIVLDPHPGEPENAFVHQLRRPAHDRFEIHQRQNLGLQVYAGGDLNQFQPLLAQREDTALGDVQHGLAAFPGFRAAEGAVQSPRRG